MWINCLPAEKAQQMKYDFSDWQQPMGQKIESTGLTNLLQAYLVILFALMETCI